MLINMFYQVPDEPNRIVSSTTMFLVDQVDLIGRIKSISFDYSLADSRDERRYLYLVLFYYYYVVHQFNETRIATNL